MKRAKKKNVPPIVHEAAVILGRRGAQVGSLEEQALVDEMTELMKRLPTSPMNSRVRTDWRDYLKIRAATKGAQRT